MSNSDETPRLLTPEQQAQEERIRKLQEALKLSDEVGPDKIFVLIVTAVLWFMILIRACLFLPPEAP